MIDPNMIDALDIRVTPPLKLRFKVISYGGRGLCDGRARLIASILDGDGVVRYYEILQGPRDVVRLRAREEAKRFGSFLVACEAPIATDYDVQFEDRCN